MYVCTYIRVCVRMYVCVYVCVCVCVSDMHVTKSLIEDYYVLQFYRIFIIRIYLP